MQRLYPGLIRGDGERIEFAVTNPDGTPRNISTDTFRFTAKTGINRPEAVIQKSSPDGIVLSNAVGGEGYVEILPEDTEGLQQAVTLVCDIQGTPAGNAARRYTQLFMVGVALNVGT